MNILFAANDYMEYGGFHNYLHRVTRALQAMGHKVTIVKCGRKNAHRYEDGIEIWEVAVYYFNNDRCLGVVGNSIRASICINRKIKEIRKKEKIDIIQFTSLRSLPILYFGKIPSIMRLSSYTKKAYPTFETLSKEIVGVMSFLEIMAGKRCNAVFAPSKVTAEAYEKDFRKRVYVIESPFINDVGKMDSRIAEKQLTGKKYILFFGNLYYEKGILTIAGMLKRFLESNREYYWVFAGKTLPVNGENAAKILGDAAGEYRDRVVFLGEIPHEQLYPVIQNSDFVVLPSIMENFSNACIESMYFHKIVVGTDGASFEQLIDDQISGFLSKIGDSEDLLDKVQKAVNLPDDVKKQMERKAHERVEKLKPEIVVRRLVKLYESVIETVK